MSDKFKELEVKLSKYKWYLKEAKQLELSIRYPYQLADGNVGGGKSSGGDNDKLLSTLIKIDENEVLNKYVKIGQAIERTFAELPEHLQEAMMEFYINRKGHYRGHPKRCAAKLNVDVSTLYRWRTEIVTEFDRQLQKDEKNKEES
ncbi:hypothetical protein [Carnobacterium inhibens]|uniref:hypothetical protein n=1 Tax=Carnobacterium inhibens TaxID=147709 RepID=UPI00203F2E26|nr:hypothetical protein [Carnobacterium inhibens]MCM3511652.1 hypothetical protein [Carnobacterium inhibens]